jgi:diguanylate cyclase (GGDEF)-like protein
LRSLFQFFVVPSDQPELVQEQLRAFSKQIPLLYFVLVANMVFLAMTHFDVAPGLLTIAFPIAFGLLAMVRIVGWWRTRHVAFDPEQSHRRLKSTVFLCAALGIVMAVWSMALLPYGDTARNGHVAFFMGVTLVACVFCLMHVRAAAFVLALVVAIPFAIKFGMLHSYVMSAIAANMILVATAMLYIVSTHYEEFTTMVRQRLSLQQTHEETLRLSAENHKLANLDSLTNLPNRRSFIARIEKLIAERTGDQGHFAVGLIDLDGFKAVNDLYGHGAGDALLVEVSRRLGSLENAYVSFARLGGDEFGFISQNVEGISVLGHNICESLRQSYLVNDVKLEISASCGMALFPLSCTTSRELLECADYALYQAKAHNNGGALTFTTSHREQLRISHQVDHALRNADLEAEMRLVYQPVVDCMTGETVALEALARWSNALLGQVSPAQFIATAERSPLINRLTRLLLKKLFADMQAFPPDVTVSFNLSAKSLTSPDVMLQIVAAIQASKIDPKRLQFEVTETALMLDFEAALRALNLLRNLGCSIALDDFGTGYSSLSYVHQLPLDTIKIDRKFVMDLDRNNKARDIVKTIVSLSDALSLKCVAEGVETPEQVKILKHNGCNLMQGFLFSVPLPAAEVGRAFDTNKKDARLLSA